MLSGAVAALVRLAAWAWISDARFASDEQGYVDAGIALAATGQQDLFWPPLTGWMVALVKSIAPATSLATLRLLWIAIDLGNLALVAMLAGRIARAALADRAGRFVQVATLAYALYLPAIAHAQFVTSEIPSLFLVLSALLILTTERNSIRLELWGGALLGLLMLARANLLPLLVMMPAAAFSQLPPSAWRRRTMIVAATGALIVAAAIGRNWILYDEATLSRNAAYNLYIGNRDLYAEDLDLFHPQATAEQIEFRRQFFAGTLQYPTGTTDELEQAALQWIVQHPAQFMRRTIGRLARVFAPKTDVLELAGGEAAVGVFSSISIALLGVANLQWAVILFAGLLGLAMLVERDRRLGLTFISTIAGGVLLCLVAIAKPRYSFVIDPLLIVAAALAIVATAGERLATWRRCRFGLAPIAGFLAWGWIAWTIFAVSSRLAQ